jgi:predicted N-acetyltransferase YhbS
VSTDIVVRPLKVDDSVEPFDCGVDDLNRWLHVHALDSAELDSARTYVAVTDEGSIAGFIALTAASVTHAQATGELSFGMPRYPLPVILLARLGVREDYKRNGIASQLVRTSMEITVEVARLVGVRGLAVDAMDEDVAAFYKRLGFTRATVNSLKLQIPTSVLRDALTP